MSHEEFTFLIVYHTVRLTCDAVLRVDAILLHVFYWFVAGEPQWPRLSLYPLCYLFSFFKLLFSWLDMLKRGFYARCSHFLWLCSHLCSFLKVDYYAKKRQLCSQLCSFLLLVCLPFVLFAIFLFVWLGFRSLFAVSLASISFPTFLFGLNFLVLRCSTPQTLPWKPSRRQTFFAPCTKCDVEYIE